MGKKYKSEKRCIISNKIVGGKDVVITDYALDYVKQMGYVVVERRRLLNKGIMAMILFCLIALIVCIPSVSAQPVTCNNNTFNIWKFNEGIGNITSESCYGYYGIINNASWINGKYGKALLFNGYDSLITTSNAFTQNLTEFSFSVWIKKERNPLAWETIFQRGNYYTNEFVELIYIGDTDELLFMNTLISNASLTDNTFHNIIGTYNVTADEVKLYIDSNLIGTTNSVQSEISSTTQPLYIGVNYANGFVFNGTIDDLALFNKTLNSTEIFKIYNNTYPAYTNPNQINIFNMDFTEIINIILLVILFIISAIFFGKKVYYASGGLLTIIGLILLFNNVNMLFSALIICIGIIIIFIKPD